MKIEVDGEELRKLVDMLLHARMEVAEADQALYDFWRKASIGVKTKRNGEDSK